MQITKGNLFLFDKDIKIFDNKFLGIVGLGAWVFPETKETFYAGPLSIKEKETTGDIWWYETFLSSGRRILLPITQGGVKLLWREYKRTDHGFTLKY